jgi:hypothetical protein
MPQTQPPPLQQAMSDTTGRASRPWAIWFQGVATFVATILNYQIVESAGAPAAPEPALNFLAPFVVTDNPTNGSTDIGISIPGGIVRVDNVNGSYIQLGDGTLIQWGAAPGIAGGGTEFVSFPKPFTTTTGLTVLTSAANGNGNIVTQAKTFTIAGFTAGIAGVVFVGGSGSSPTGAESIEWMAMGH